MASQHPAAGDREEEELDAALIERVRSRTREGAELLPGALVLLGYHLLVLRAGGLSRLLPLAQLVFGASLVTITLSVLLLALSLGVRSSLPPETRRSRRLLQARALATAGPAALSAALAGDFFVVAARLTGSPDAGAVAGAVVLVLIYVPWS
jgi:hypothetical protein